VVDIGAGDGWWSQRMAEAVGDQGMVYASEVDQKKVDKMKESLAEISNLKPYLSSTEGTDLPENSCDLAFMSKVYHHLGEGTHVAYLQHLLQVVRPTGRLCIIEKYPELTPQRRAHGWSLSQLVKQAEEAGWIPVRCELIRGTYHYVAIFVPRDLFPPPPAGKKS
jgi:ubiquinone/menaquinone biosynthesis C-methylase UbiE